MKILSIIVFSLLLVSCNYNEKKEISITKWQGELTCIDGIQYEKLYSGSFMVFEYSSGLGHNIKC